MDQYELELRRALARQEPESDLTSLVMEKVRRQAFEEKKSPKVIAMPRKRSRVWRWAAVGAVAASLTVGVVVEQRRSQRRAAETAEAQLYEALMLAGQKVSQARAGVRGTQGEIQ